MAPKDWDYYFYNAILLLLKSKLHLFEIFVAGSSNTFYYSFFSENGTHL